jgi:hypothetical protein
MHNQHLFNTLSNLFGVTALESDMDEIVRAVRLDHLIAISCSQPCSPSDWQAGGLCDRNGCYKPVITPGTYTCTTPFTNEMGYTWKQGEQIEVLRYSYQYQCCMCIIPGQPQQFEMHAKAIRQHFQLS